MSLNQIDPDRRLWMYDGMGNKVYKGDYNQPYDGIDLEKLLVILMEECGELTQRCSKVLRHGAGHKQMQDIHEEAADVKCLMDILIAEDFLNETEIDRLAELKKQRLIKRGFVSK
jgi:NTP pyrophosphatase (non-canonical NTP hydrolase)